MASNAPASHAGPSGRGTPRWSVAVRALRPTIVALCAACPARAGRGRGAHTRLVVGDRSVQERERVAPRPPAVASGPTGAALARAAGAAVGDAGGAAVAANAARPAA